MQKVLTVALVSLLLRGSFGRTVREASLHRYDVIFGTKNELLCDEPSSEVRTEWRRTDGSDLPAGASQQNGLLTIDPTGHDAEGHYECVAQIPGSNAETVVVQVFLNVIVPPRITFKLSPPLSKVHPGDKVALLCDVSGDQPIQVSWHKANGESLPDRVTVNGKYLEFAQISKEDDGRYICRASNRAGNATRTAEIRCRNKN
uniref:Putative conserved secreted protein n=1 Tax=Culex tarsalis TaxID=7177 RepID=A0A1Q3FNN3_CULTA